MKSEPGPPMTLSVAAAAQVRPIVWCKSRQHQVEPDPAEMCARYGAETSVLASGWCVPLRQSQCRHGGDRHAARRSLTGAAPPLPLVFSLRGLDRLPLEVGRRIGAAAVERHDVIFNIAGAGAAGSPGRGTRMLALKLALRGIGSSLSC
jgi:hypothetical protein